MHSISLSYFSLELTKTLILPELVELTKDEQLIVRQAGIQTVSNILTLLDDGRLWDTAFDLVSFHSDDRWPHS